MLPKGKKAAIYARKSKFTGKGESIDNQITLCKKRIREVYGEVSDEDIVIFQDEGFSGGNINRPDFTRMMKLIEKKEFFVVCIYKLDRFSRNVADFANTYTTLESTGTDFLSVTERYETNTAMGKAMMSVSVVFAQLERETTAERIRDNLYELSKTGVWLGGNCPSGYKSKKITKKVEVDGKERVAHKLEIFPEEAETIAIIFSKFLELKSLSQVVAYLIKNGIKSKEGTDYSRFSVKTILKNPVYVACSEDIYEYFKELGSEIFCERSEFNGQYGMMVYNKTIQKTGKSVKERDVKEWVVAIGKHSPIIDSKTWLEAQDLLTQNKSKSFRQPKSNNAILSGILRCGECGAFMRPKADHRRKTPEGESRFTYVCEMKALSKKSVCSIKAVNQGNELDKTIIEVINNISKDREDIFNDIKKTAKSILEDKENYDKELAKLKKSKIKIEKDIDAGMSNLLKMSSKVTIRKLEEQIEELQKQSDDITSRINEIEQEIANKELSLSYFDQYINQFANFTQNFNTMTAAEKTLMLRTIIDRIIWDGEKFDIILAGGSVESVAPQGEDSK